MDGLILIGCGIALVLCFGLVGSCGFASTEKNSEPRISSVEYLESDDPVIYRKAGQYEIRKGYVVPYPLRKTLSPKGTTQLWFSCCPTLSTQKTRID